MRVDSRVMAVPLVALEESNDVRDLEVVHLGRYALVALLVSLSGLLWAWSRIDLRETAVGLDAADKELQLTRGEHERLRVELAAIRGAAMFAHGPSFGGSTQVIVSHPVDGEARRP